jgi:hypothetical protein
MASYSSIQNPIPRRAGLKSKIWLRPCRAVTTCLLNYILSRENPKGNAFLRNIRDFPSPKGHRYGYRRKCKWDEDISEIAEEVEDGEPRAA